MTQEQIAKLAELQGVSVEVAEGTLAMFERGEGELPAEIFDAAETAPLFADVRAAYFAAHGVAEVPLSKIDEEVLTPPAEETL